MSELPACVVCGCSSYNKVSGFYVCANCDTQSQEIQVQLFDYSTNLRVDEDEDREEIVTKKIDEERPLTSWEIYNLALKRIVEELISLGISPELKIVAFQLWATYLQKANVAFFSKQPDKLPSLPLGFKSSDAKILYGISNLRKLLYKDLKHSKKDETRGDDSDVAVDALSSSSSSYTSGTAVSLKSLRKKQRKLALTELSDSSIQNESMFSHNESLQTLSSDRISKKSRKKISFKSASKKVYYKMKAAVEKTKNLSINDTLVQKLKAVVYKRIYNHKRKPGACADMVVTFTTIISVIRTALLLIGENILLGDIMRWIGEGHISYNLRNLSINSTKSLEGDEIWVPVCNRNGFQKDIENFSKIIGFSDIPSPDLYLLAETYCRELCLPAEFVNYVHGLMNIYQPKMQYSEYNHRLFPNYEGRVLAYILFAFKLLFSLDGITERKQSEFADYINEMHSRKSDLPLLFSWNAWIQLIQCRKAVLSKYDPIVNNQAYEGRVDNKHVILKQWNKARQRNAIHCHQFNEVFISTATQALKKVASDEESEVDINFPASITPQTACISYLLITYPELIEPEIRTILENRFTNYSILHLLDHQWCQDIATTCGTTVNFVEGTAVEDIKFYKEEEDSDLPSISKSTTVPAYAPTHVRIIDDEADVQKQSSILKPQRCKKFKYEFESFEYHEPRSNSTNDFKIYKPAKNYWFFHEYSRSVSNEKFSELSETHLSENFVWLLKELASMITGETKEIYLELITIEAVMYSLLENGNFATKCPFAVYPNEW